MDATRDPWTDKEIKIALDEAMPGSPAPDVIIYAFSLFQRAVIALEKLADEKEVVELFEAPISDGLGHMGTGREACPSCGTTSDSHAINCSYMDGRPKR